MNTRNSLFESVDFTAIAVASSSQSLTQEKSLMELSNPSVPVAQNETLVLLRRFGNQAQDWIKESPTESAIRRQGLRKVTIALFVLGISLTCLLNIRLLAVGVNLQQLIVCNLGIMIVYVLAGICLLHDVTFRRKNKFDEEHLGVSERLAMVVGQVDALESQKFSLISKRDKLVAEHAGLTKNLIDLENRVKSGTEKSKQIEESLASVTDQKTVLQSELDQLNSQHQEWTERSIEDEIKSKTGQLLLNQLQMDIQLLEDQRSANAESVNFARLELDGLEDSARELRNVLSVTQEELSMQMALKADDQNELNRLESKQLEIIQESEGLESEKALVQAKLAQLKLELECVELECVRVHALAAIVNEQSQPSDQSETTQSRELSTELATEPTQELATELAQELDNESKQELATELAQELEEVSEHLAIAKSNLANLRLELVCLELECARVRNDVAIALENSGLELAKTELVEVNRKLEDSRSSLSNLNELEQNCIEATARHEQLLSDSQAIELQILEQEQERSELQRRIEISYATEAVASHRLSNLNEQVFKLDLDQTQLSETIERLVGEVELQNEVRRTFTDSNTAATESLERLLDSVESLSRKEAGLVLACNSAEGKLELWTTNAESLVSRVDELTLQITALEAQRLQAVDGMETLLEEIDNKSAEHLTLSESIEFATRKMDELNAELIENRVRKDQAETELRDVEFALNSSRNQLVEFEKQLAQTSDNCLSEQSELRCIHEQLEVERRAVEQLRSEFDSLVEQKLNLGSDLVNLGEQRELSQRACDEANGELQRMIELLDATSDELLAKEELANKLNDRLIQLRSIETELNAKGQKLEELTHQQQDTEESCRDTQEQLLQLQADVRSVKVELSLLNNAEAESLLKANKMQAENEQLEGTYHTFHQKIQATQQELTTLQLRLAQIEAEMHAAAQRKTELQRALDSYANDADEAQNVCKQWADYGSQLRADNDTVESELGRLRSECKELRVEQDRLVQDKQALSVGISSLRNQRDTLQSEIVNREDFLAELKKEQNQIVKQLATHNANLINAQADSVRLESECNVAQLELNNLQSQRRFESTSVQELAIQHRQLQGDVNALTMMIDQLRADSEEYHRQLDDLTTRRQVIEESIHEGKSHQSELSTKLLSMKQELELAKESMQAVLVERQSEVDQVHSLQSEAIERRLEINGVQIQISALELELSEKREESRELDLRLEELRNDSQQANQLLHTKLVESDDVARSLDDRTRDLAEMERVLATSQSKVEFLEIELAKRTGTLKLLEESLLDAERKVANQQTKVFQSEESLESLRSQALDTQADLTRLSGLRGEAESALIGEELRAKEVQTLNEALMNERASLTELIHAEKMRLETTLLERVAAESAKHSLESTNTSLQHNALDLTSKRDNLIQVVSKLNREFELSAERSEETQAKIASSLGQLEILEVRKRDLLDQESIISDRTARLQEELASLESDQSKAKLVAEKVATSTRKATWTPEIRKVALKKRPASTSLESTSEKSNAILERTQETRVLDSIEVDQTIELLEAQIVATMETSTQDDPWSVVLN